MLSHIAQSQSLINLIKQEFSIEIPYYASPDVAATTHAVGGPDPENWTQALFQEKMISSLPSTGDRFVELERTLTVIYCFHLQKLSVDEAYQAFTAAQRNNPEIPASEVLSLASFQKQYDLVKKIISDSDKEAILLRLMTYSDLGKAPQFKKKIASIAEEEKISIIVNQDPDDLITDMFQKLNDRQIQAALPSYASLSPDARLVLKTIYPIMQACFGHILFLERGVKTFQIIADALSKIPVTLRKEALNLVFLAQFYDAIGAQGQKKIAGSLTCTENFSMAYFMIHQALNILESSLEKNNNPSEAAKLGFQHYVSARANLLGLPPILPGRDFLTRMACMIRGFTPEFAAILIDEFVKLLDEHQAILIAQLSFDDQGFESWTKTHYIATTPQNISRSLFAANKTREGINRALNATVCFAMLTDEISKENQEQVRDKQRVLSFGVIANLATKTPGIFDPKTFNPKAFFFNPKNNKIEKKEEKEPTLGLKN